MFIFGAGASSLVSTPSSSSGSKLSYLALSLMAPLLVILVIGCTLLFNFWELKARVRVMAGSPGLF